MRIKGNIGAKFEDYKAGALLLTRRRLEPTPGAGKCRVIARAKPEANQKAINSWFASLRSQ